MACWAAPGDAFQVRRASELMITRRDRQVGVDVWPLRFRHHFSLTWQMGTACAAQRLHYLAGEILAVALIVVPLVVGAILVAVIVFCSTRSSDRVFRLLRWLRDKEEPPAPRRRSGSTRP
jgi:hypothetical protein